jgi:hypothetical protein
MQSNVVDTGVTTGSQCHFALCCGFHFNVSHFRFSFAPLSVVLLTTKSENHIREMELCLEMRPWAETFGILDYETRLQGTRRSETKMRGYFRGRQSEGYVASR